MITLKLKTTSGKEIELTPEEAQEILNELNSLLRSVVGPGILTLEKKPDFWGGPMCQDTSVCNHEWAWSNMNFKQCKKCQIWEKM